MAKAQLTTEAAPPAFDQQTNALVTIDPPASKQIPASQTDSVLADIGLGAIGDYISHLICTVSTASTSQVQIKDGSGTAYTLIPNNAPIGVYKIDSIGFSKAGAWKVTTAAGVTVLARGRF